jgi:hypothetical protein
MQNKLPPRVFFPHSAFRVLHSAFRVLHFLVSLVFLVVKNAFPFFISRGLTK